MRRTRGGGKRHLLDVLARRAGCDCLSDLRLESNRPSVLCVLEKICPTRYPQIEWLEALRYLLKRVP